MKNKTEIGRVVWHDLITNEVAKAKRFYAELLDWEYQIEHATDFTWAPGEKSDYPLILANGEAHGGFVDPRRDIPSHWLAWVAVEDVDAVTTRARRLGATIDHEPFDTPGVGRGAVIRDPQGALISPYVRTHDFPAPSGTFLWDELMTDDLEFAKMFYSELFGWKASDVDMGQTGTYTIFKRAGNIDAAGAIKRPPGATGPATWVTYLATDDVNAIIAKARMLGASVHMEGTDVPNVGRFAILTDSTGAMFGLLKPNAS